MSCKSKLRDESASLSFV